MKNPDYHGGMYTKRRWRLLARDLSSQNHILKMCGRFLKGSCLSLLISMATLLTFGQIKQEDCARLNLGSIKCRSSQACMSILDEFNRIALYPAVAQDLPDKSFCEVMLKLSVLDPYFSVDNSVACESSESPSANSFGLLFVAQPSPQTNPQGDEGVVIAPLKNSVLCMTHKICDLVRLTQIGSLRITPSTSLEQIKGALGGSRVDVQVAGNEAQLTISRKQIRPSTLELIAEKDKNRATLRIYDFSMTTMNEFADAVRNIRNVFKDSCPQIVIDLRANLGGLLYTALDMASLFVDAKTELACQVARVEKGIRTDRGMQYHFYRQMIKAPSMQKHPAAWDYLFKVCSPPAILVSQYTKSSAEIFASILSRERDARIIGQRTFGKFLAQNKRLVGSYCVTNSEMEILFPRENKPCVPDTLGEDGRPAPRLDPPSTQKRPLVPDVEVDPFDARGLDRTLTELAKQPSESRGKAFPISPRGTR